jgi:hypothetical protein
MKALRRIWIGDNAGQMLTAVGNKQIAEYLSLRKKVVEQILEFDAELGVPPFSCDVKGKRLPNEVTLNVTSAKGGRPKPEEFC